MKRFLSTASLIAAFATVPSAFAAEGEGCHFHGYKPASEATVLGCANQRKDALVASGKLDKSWQAVRHDKAVMAEGKDGKEWKVTFKDAAKDKSKETLYVIFTLPGNFIGANLTGQ